jgi:SAM-dependent methyltransferase
MPRSTTWLEMPALRALLSRHLVGAGVELGPGHHPFPVPYDGVRVTYVDRWLPDENRNLFPELGEAAFPVPDIVANLDVDKLAALEDDSQDFVIASHILEHLADPIGMIDEMHRVLKPGGIALILLPDRRRTFDRRRHPTSLWHLVAEHEAEVTEVDDEHIVEFIRYTETDAEVAAFDRMEREEQSEVIARHRERSIHAHCWTADEFTQVIAYTIGRLGHTWEFVDGALTEDEGPTGMEFGYVLRRTEGLRALAASDRERRFVQAWSVWADERRTTHQLTDDLRRDIDDLHQSLGPRPWKTAVKDVARPIVGPLIRPVRRVARKRAPTHSA